MIYLREPPKLPWLLLPELRELPAELRELPAELRELLPAELRDMEPELRGAVVALRVTVEVLRCGVAVARLPPKLPLVVGLVRDMVLRVGATALGLVVLPPWRKLSELLPERVPPKLPLVLPERLPPKLPLLLVLT